MHILIHVFFYIVLTPISTTSGLWSTGNMRKYHQIDVYIYQCDTERIKKNMFSVQRQPELNEWLPQIDIDLLDAKVKCWVGKTKFYTNGLKFIRMVATPIYGNYTLRSSSSLEPKAQRPRDFVCSIWVVGLTEFVKWWSKVELDILYFIKCI